jgi:hypothetical protein
MNWGTGDSYVVPPEPPPPYDQIEPPFPWAQRVGTVFVDDLPMVVICHAQATGITPLMVVNPYNPDDVRVLQCGNRIADACLESLQHSCWLFQQGNILSIYIFDPYINYPELQAPRAVISDSCK